ncbi:hypothetical protein JG005_00002 [Pseudomonas phage JG005]
MGCISNLSRHLRFQRYVCRKRQLVLFALEDHSPIIALFQLSADLFNELLEVACDLPVLLELPDRRSVVCHEFLGRRAWRQHRLYPGPAFFHLSIQVLNSLFAEFHVQYEATVLLIGDDLCNLLLQLNRRQPVLDVVVPVGQLVVFVILQPVPYSGVRLYVIDTVVKHIGCEVEESNIRCQMLAEVDLGVTTSATRQLIQTVATEQVRVTSLGYNEGIVEYHLLAHPSICRPSS